MFDKREAAIKHWFFLGKVENSCFEPPFLENPELCAPDLMNFMQSPVRLENRADALLERAPTLNEKHLANMNEEINKEAVIRCRTFCPTVFMLLCLSNNKSSLL
mmetsp:Transcript_4544/g.6266  ORF Transcript_4544/g.6266 Transcript_4544/m.6266 type:complete len:104 (-) Transcript_4544:30-341(-)